jgi:Fe-S cluster assembly protein SufD
MATAGDAKPSPGEIEAFLYPGLPHLVVVDGHYSEALSRLPDQELEVGGLARALASGQARSLGSLASFRDRAFVALNTALFQDGVALRVAPGQQVEGPVQILFVSTSRGDAPRASYPRLLLELGAGSGLEVVESYVSLGSGTAFTCAVTETMLGEGASLKHYRVQREGRGSHHLFTHRSRIAAHAQLDLLSLDLGSALARNEFHSQLDGAGSFARLSGLGILTEDQHLDNQLHVEHRESHGSSHQLFKGILHGASRAVFNGLIHVHPDAQKTDAKQTNRNLLLSESALVHSNPQLKIFADDVRCTHGSTVGELDEKALFYLRSRGLSKAVALEILVRGFAHELVDAIRLEPLRHEVEAAVAAGICGRGSSRRAA